MADLRTSGFQALVAEVAELAGKQPTVTEAAGIACTLDGRVLEALGLAALSAPERGVLEHMSQHGALLGGTDGGWVLWLTDTGRLKIGRPGSGKDDNAHVIGLVRWPASAADGSRTAEQCWQRESSAERAGYEQIAGELASEPRRATLERLALIGDAVTHMAPVLIYVGDHIYSNLGSHSTMPSKPAALGAPGSVLVTMATSPVAQWCAEDAVFVACGSALIRSGAPIRLEEFNGTQLTPACLEAWLCERLREYGTAADGPAADQGVLARLDALARCCAEARTALLREGTQFYRAIQGVNLHKRERLLVPPAIPSDIPPGAAAFLRDAGIEPGAGGAATAEPALAKLAPLLAAPSADPLFGTVFEEFLHGLLKAVAADTESDVVMARGPRNLACLAGSVTPPEQVLKLPTSENYCCVVPSEAFQARFAHDRQALVKAIAAYSARMRYNTWHYLPDGLGLRNHQPGRDDWFYAPATPDIATWSDQHHTGHVMFGVRYTIRIPIGITFDGAYRPGLYDLRLMRTGEPPFVEGELRAGIAVSQALGAIHQAMTAHDHRVSAFNNQWFRSVYG